MANANSSDTRTALTAAPTTGNDLIDTMVQTERLENKDNVVARLQKSRKAGLGELRVRYLTRELAQLGRAPTREDMPVPQCSGAVVSSPTRQENIAVKKTSDLGGFGPDRPAEVSKLGQREEAFTSHPLPQCLQTGSDQSSKYLVDPPAKDSTELLDLMIESLQM